MLLVCRTASLESCSVLNAIVFVDLVKQHMGITEKWVSAYIWQEIVLPDESCKKHLVVVVHNSTHCWNMKRS